MAYFERQVGKAEPSYDGVSRSTARAWDYSRVAAGNQTDGFDQDLPPGLRACDFDRFYDRQNVVGEALLEGVAAVLGLPAETFSAQGDLGTIRLIHYAEEVRLWFLCYVMLGRRAGLCAWVDLGRLQFWGPPLDVYRRTRSFFGGCRDRAAHGL